MKSKALDVPYCGVREEKILDANPVLDPRIVGFAYEWMHDRYEIHILKDVAGAPAPWTQNPILRQVKFCNVRREHDRQSINLIQNIANNDALGMADQMFNCVLFRMFNLWEPIKAIGGARTIKEFAEIDLDVTRQRLTEFEEAGGKTFTNAFNTGGLKQCLAFPEMVVNHKEQRFGGMMVKLHRKGTGLTLIEEMDYKVAKKLAEENPGEYTIEGWEPHMGMRVVRALRAFVNAHPDFFHNLLRLDSPDKVYEALLNNVEGLGPFLAYQIWVDFTYLSGYPFSENHFTIAGPGCRAGIDLMFTNKDGMTSEECIFWLRDNQEKVFGPLGYVPWKFWYGENNVDRQMNVMQLENLFCELQKYTRCKDALARGDKPRGKVGYDGAGVPAKSVNLMDKFKRG